MRSIVTYDFFILLQFDETLVNMYKYLQMLAVGLEQVVFDQAAYGGRYLEEFNETEFRLKAVSVKSFLHQPSQINS